MKQTVCLIICLYLYWVKGINRFKETRCTKGHKADSVHAICNSLTKGIFTLNMTTVLNTNSQLQTTLCLCIGAQTNIQTGGCTDLKQYALRSFGPGMGKMCTSICQGLREAQLTYTLSCIMTRSYREIVLDVVISTITKGPEMLVTLLSKTEVKIPSSNFPQILTINENISNKFETSAVYLQLVHRCLVILCDSSILCIIQISVRD